LADRRAPEFFIFREQKWFGPRSSGALQKKMNWDQAADVIPDLLKLELVRSDDRFSTGLKEVLHVGS